MLAAVAFAVGVDAKLNGRLSPFSFDGKYATAHKSFREGQAGLVLVVADATDQFLLSRIFGKLAVKKNYQKSER